MVFIFPPAATEILSGPPPSRKREPEPRFQQRTREDAPAFEDQLGFCAKDQGTNFQHPTRCRQTELGSPRPPQHSHELGVRQWMRRREIDGAFQLVIDQPLDSADKIHVVDPRDKLPSIAIRPTETDPNQAE